MIRTLFLGTPHFASHCLEALLSDKDFKIVGVVSQPDSRKGRGMRSSPSPVKQLARDHKLKTLNSLDFQTLKPLNIDLVVVVAFGQILSSEFLENFPKKVVNIHGSLLPLWRGAAPIQRAIMNGDSITGVSLQVVSKELDAGDVIGTRQVKIGDKDAKELFGILEKKSVELLLKELKLYAQGELIPTPQDSTQATYAKKIKKEESRLDWREDALVLHNKIRGLAMGPRCFCFLDKVGKKVLKITKTQVLANFSRHDKEQIGKVINLKDDFFTVACRGKSVLKVLRVQMESRKEMSAKEFLKGYPLRKNQRLY